MKEATGEDISKEELGGPTVALPSGVIHNVADTDEAVLDDIRQYLSYFPSSAWSYPPPTRLYDEEAGLRPTPELLDIISRDNRNIYDMRTVLDVSSTRRTGSRFNRSSARPSSARWPIWAAIRSRSSRISRPNWPAPSTPTPQTRPRTSSWSPTRSTCRSSSWPTTPACCREASLSAMAYCAAGGQGCSPRRPRPPR